MADNSSLTFLQFFLPVFFFLSPSHLLSLLLPATNCKTLSFLLFLHQWWGQKMFVLVNVIMTCI
uniref:Conotoxin Superfamily SF1 n=1 Tax=Conus episcopatus TaxID=88764 RepID=A0A0K2S7X0_CONEP|nr:Conotoxin Superfamily SF1 [Conus episcopatus]